MLRDEVESLKLEILRLEVENKRLEKDAKIYREDYLYYHAEFTKLSNKDFNRTIENLDQLKKNSLMHNARGAGRKSRFTEEQVEEIKKLREDGNTIKEIATRFECSVGLIHKLINEK
ncbi:MAG: helix-turn-helix domain-containing protein [Paraclostridium sp.]